jgi:hypothetical protein
MWHQHLLIKMNDNNKKTDLIVALGVRMTSLSTDPFVFAEGKKNLRPTLYLTRTVP